MLIPASHDLACSVRRAEVDSRDSPSVVALANARAHLGKKRRMDPRFRKDDGKIQTCADHLIAVEVELELSLSAPSLTLPLPRIAGEGTLTSSSFGRTADRGWRS
jgi:hypothetical protein